jgi:fumarate hydratase, class II
MADRPGRSALGLRGAMAAHTTEGIAMTEKQLWGGETAKAVENFPISGETVPVSVVRWLARLKGAAAAVNAELGLLDKRRAGRIERAAAEIAAGRHDGQFPIDVFQTGSGTSTNTNANEVIAALATDKDPARPVHPNDHVNMGQSSNDVFPSAVHLAALDVAQNELLPALRQLERAFARKAKSFQGVVKAGRTHLMDAVPVTLGQEFAGYAAQMALGQERVRAALVHVGQIPLGGTATGTGLNTHPKFAERVRARLKKESGLRQIAPPLDRFEAQANRDALVELSGALKVIAVSLTKIAGDLALMGSGPRAGIGELFLPELQKGSSIMPGKVNPVICEVVLQVSAQVIGNDTAITVGGMQGQFELNVRIPLIARNLLQSLHLLSTASRAFAEKCVDGVRANRAGTEASAGATLAVATALNGAIGYDKGATIVKKATDSGRPLREVALEEGVDPKLYDATIDLPKIARGNRLK